MSLREQLVALGFEPVAQVQCRNTVVAVVLLEALPDVGIDLRNIAKLERALHAKPRERRVAQR